MSTVSSAVSRADRDEKRRIIRTKQRLAIAQQPACGRRTASVRHQRAGWDDLVGVGGQFGEAHGSVSDLRIRDGLIGDLVCRYSAGRQLRVGHNAVGQLVSRDGAVGQLGGRYRAVGDGSGRGEIGDLVPFVRFKAYAGRVGGVGDVEDRVVKRC